MKKRYRCKFCFILSLSFFILTLSACTLQKNFSLYSFGIKVTPQMFGAKADGFADDTDAIQSAVDALSVQGGGILFFPKGMYCIGQFNAYAKDVGYGAINIKSNIRFVGEEGSVLKVADGVNKKDFAWQAVFIGRYEENTTNVVFENLEFDLNGANNFYPYNGDSKKNTCNAAIRTSYPKNITVQDCTFKNCPGLNCVALGYANGALIKNNRFLNNADVIEGNKVHDHSCILVAGQDVIVEDNLLRNDRLSKVSTAIEINSIGAIVRNNYAENFKVACLLSPVGITSLLNVNVENNQFVENSISLQLWHQEEITESAHVVFSENTIIANSTKSNGQYAIDLRSYAKWPIEDVLVKDNKIMMSGEENSGFYGGVIIGGTSNNIRILDNHFDNLPGTAVSVIEGASDISISGNIFENCSSSDDKESNRVVLVNPEGKISRDIKITNNSFKQKDKKNIRGIWLINDCQSTTISDNTFVGFEPYNEIDGALLKSKASVKILR